MMHILLSILFINSLNISAIIISIIASVTKPRLFPAQYIGTGTFMGLHIDWFGTLGASKQVAGVFV